MLRTANKFDKREYVGRMWRRKGRRVLGAREGVGGPVCVQICLFRQRAIGGLQKSRLAPFAQTPRLAPLRSPHRSQERLQYRTVMLDGLYASLLVITLVWKRKRQSFLFGSRHVLATPFVEISIQKPRGVFADALPHLLLHCHLLLH